MVMHAIEAQQHTVDDLLAMPDDGKRYELIDGEIVEMGSSSDKHAVLGTWLIWLIMSYIRSNNLGGRLKGADGTYRLDAANVRVPDVSYVIEEKAATLPPGTVFGPFAPDFVIEIKSPSQSAPKMRRLARQFIQAGSRLVWIINFEDEHVLVYRPGHAVEHFSDEDVLDGLDILPGFTLKVNDMFAEIAKI